MFAVGAFLIVLLGDIGELPKDEFHNTAAQIIPVLLLALVVESRPDAIWGTESARPIRALVLAFLLIGELSALLETGDVLAQDEISAAATGAGLVVGFVAVVLVALMPASDRPQRGAD